MAAPLAAGAAVIIRYIAKHGIEAAIKRFGSTVVKEVSKMPGASNLFRFQKGGSTVKKPVNKRKKTRRRKK